MRAAIAAGHPATVEAGLEILADGGSAADAAVAACLASCVAETVMTGIMGGGHAIVYDAASGTARNLDCFVAVPGLDGAPREVELLELDVPFGLELVHYAVGIASCGVPGVMAGLEALHRDHGRLPWQRLVEPALRLAVYHQVRACAINQRLQLRCVLSPDHDHHLRLLRQQIYGASQER